MKILPAPIEGVQLIEPDLFRDRRGRFQEVWQLDRYRDRGLDADFVQDNLSHSQHGTLRGLHYQIQHPQGKLVQVLSGKIFDVVVDLRQASGSFGKWFGVELDAAQSKQIFIPPGCAHGFLVLSETADVFYKCTDRYYAQYERTLIWNDPDLNIDWPRVRSLLLSDKDRSGTPLSQAELYGHDF